MAAMRSSSSESLGSPRGLAFTRSIKQPGRQRRALALSSSPSSTSTTSSRTADRSDSDRSCSSSPRWAPLSAVQPSAQPGLRIALTHSTPAAGDCHAYTAHPPSTPSSSTKRSTVRQLKLTPASTASGTPAQTPASHSRWGALPNASPPAHRGAGTCYSHDKENAGISEPSDSRASQSAKDAAGSTRSIHVHSGPVLNTATANAQQGRTEEATPTARTAGCSTSSLADSSSPAVSRALAPAPATASTTLNGSAQQTPTCRQHSTWHTPEQQPLPQQQLLRTPTTHTAVCTPPAASMAIFPPATSTAVCTPPATSTAVFTPAVASTIAPGTILDPYTPWLCTAAKQRRSSRSSSSGQCSPIVLSSDTSSNSAYSDADDADACNRTAGRRGRSSDGNSSGASSINSRGSGQLVFGAVPAALPKQPLNGVGSCLNWHGAEAVHDAYAFLGTDDPLANSSKAGSKASSRHSSSSDASSSGRIRTRRRLIIADDSDNASASPAAPSTNTAGITSQPAAAINSSHAPAHHHNKQQTSAPGVPSSSNHSKTVRPPVATSTGAPRSSHSKPLQHPGTSSIAAPSYTPRKPLQPPAALTEALPALKAMPPRPRGGRAGAQMDNSWQQHDVSRRFARQRQQMAQALYAEWNETVFEGELPVGLPLVWNARLLSTAGQVVDDRSHNHLKTQHGQKIACRLELSPKVIDTEERLRSTLAHEMCHVGAWMISHDYTRPHGEVFRHWGRRFEALVPGIEVTTCHTYEIHKPHRWQCKNLRCGKVFSRHSTSIDPKKHVCGVCRSKLAYLGKFGRDGQAAAPKAPPSAFSLYVKQHFATTKKGLPPGTPHREVMSSLGSAWKASKEATAATAAAAAAAAAAAVPTPAAAAAVPTAAGSTAAAPGMAGATAAGTAAASTAAATAAGTTAAGMAMVSGVRTYGIHPIAAAAAVAAALTPSQLSANGGQDSDELEFVSPAQSVSAGRVDSSSEDGSERGSVGGLGSAVQGIASFLGRLALVQD